jgi:uncharacterized protein (TIGR01777 family)
MRVVVTGATGFIGRALVAALRARGDEVTALARDADAAGRTLGVPAIAADLEIAGPWQATVAAAEAVIHLAGEPVAGDGRWDARKKQRIRDSRVESTRLIVEAIAATPAGARPATLITASGIDYYGASDPSLDLGDDDPADHVAEHEPAGASFLARVCAAWEAEARAADLLGVRTVQLRIGLVIGRGGGAIATMLKLFKLGLGGPLGGGKQICSWIHQDDVVAIITTALDDARYRGPLNLVAPELVRQRAFARALARALGRPGFLPAPAFAIRAALGEFAEYVLTGRAAVPAKLEALGYRFVRPTLLEAFRDIGAAS